MNLVGYSFAINTQPYSLTNVSGVLFFATNQQLWKSDGTLTGTVPIKVFEPVNPGYRLTGLTDFNGTLYFVSKNCELWKSDGNPDGTLLAVDLCDIGQDLRNLTAAHNKLYFLLGDSHLWETDGTQAETKEITSFGSNSGVYSSGIASLLEVNGVLVFAANDNSMNTYNPHGWELWTSDGTQDGTRLLKDINPGPTGSMPQSLVRIQDNLLVFSASDGQSGLELWQTDGTEQGTYRLTEINPGPAPSNPRGFTIAGPALFFWADDGKHGYELWGIPTPNRAVK